jgi:glucose-1-phosphate cytidylyltransferase
LLKKNDEREEFLYHLFVLVQPRFVVFFHSSLFYYRCELPAPFFLTIYALSAAKGMNFIMKVVLLAGGAGTRISEESQFRPKPMVEIGGLPILWHIMKTYSHFGFNEFIICAGYKQHMIKEWFADYFLHTCDVTFDFTQGNEMIVHSRKTESWKVTIVDTGLETMTGGRIKRVQKYIGDEPFFMTYGDGVCDVNIRTLLNYHRDTGKKATITAVQIEQRFGVLDICDGTVRSFREKAQKDKDIINAGYMVLEPTIFELLRDDTTVFEKEPLSTLVQEGELASYLHSGYWQCMDTMRERGQLENLWVSGNAPWKVWCDVC